MNPLLVATALGALAFAAAAAGLYFSPNYDGTGPTIFAASVLAVVCGGTAVALWRSDRKGRKR